MFLLYQILLFHDKWKGYCKLKDYLQLSGCNVVEGNLELLFDYKEEIQHVDAILLYCERVEEYFVTCKKIRNQTQVPVMVLSQNNDEWAKIKMFQCGVDDYMIEPVSQGEMLARIKAHIGRYQCLTRPLGYIQAGKIEINVFARQVKVNGKEIFFRAKEFDLLLYLAQRMNRVITKEQIYEDVWKDNLGGGYYNSVAVHIKRIRKKIEDNPDSPKIIETVWGVGYVFRF